MNQQKQNQHLSRGQEGQNMFAGQIITLDLNI